MAKIARILVLFLGFSLLLSIAGCYASLPLPPPPEPIEVHDEKGTQGEIEEATVHAVNCKGDELMNMILPAES